MYDGLEVFALYPHEPRPLTPQEKHDFGWVLVFFSWMIVAIVLASLAAAGGGFTRKFWVDGVSETVVHFQNAYGPR